MHTLIIRRLALVIVLIFSTLATACHCASPPPNLKTPLALAEWRLSRSDVVFEGSVDHIDVKGWPLKVVPGTTLSTAIRIAVTFSDVRIYRGTTRPPFVVETGIGTGDCGYPFEKGRSYLVAASPNESGQLSTGICSATQPLESAGTTLRMLRGEPPASDDLRDLSIDSLDGSTPASGPRKLCGRVKLPKGVKLGEVDVHVWKFDDELKFIPVALDEEQARPNGSFCFTRLGPGKYLIGAQSNAEYDGFRYVGYYPHTAQRSEAKPIEFSGSKSDPKVEFPLVRQSLYTLRGSVEGTGLQDVKILLMGADFDIFNAPEPAVPNEDGSFRFNNVPPGRYSLFATTGDDDKVTFLSAALEFEVTGNREGLKLELIPRK
jgi:hypothetical protein